MDEQSAKNLASQLKQPSGEEGIKTGHWMNQGNKLMNLNTLDVLAAGGDDCILEIGMGNGYFVGDILKKSSSIVYKGCDFSDIMIEESKKINKDWIEKGQAEFIHSGADKLPFPDNSFNKIFTINTIYFWEDSMKVLEELKRVLKDGGSLIIALRPKRQMQTYPFTQYGFTMYSKEEAELLLEKNGFKVMSALENKEPDYEVNGQVLKVENIVIKATKK